MLKLTMGIGDRVTVLKDETRRPLGRGEEGSMETMAVR